MQSRHAMGQRNVMKMFVLAALLVYEGLIMIRPLR
jgi:hypothetical protein